MTVWDVLEVVAVVSGMIYVFLQVKKTRRMWRWMIVSSVFNGIVFSHKEFYSMTFIQLYYIGMSIYGLYTWTGVIGRAVEQHGPEDRVHRTKIAVVKPSFGKILISTLVSVVAFIGMSYVTNLSYSPVPGDIPFKPYWDAAVAVLSMLATFYLSQSYILTWYIWLAVNVLGIIMFLYPVFVGHSEQALVLVGLLYVYYLVTSAFGLANWRKNGVVVK